MNKWKIAFWVTIIIFLVTLGICFKKILDQSITLSRTQYDYFIIENDLKILSNIIVDTDISKKHVQQYIFNNRTRIDYMKFNGETISLDRVTLIFKNDKLFKLKMH